MNALNRRTIRAPLNPLDVSTVVSIFPREICEVKPTLQPGTFRLGKGTFETPAILVVTSSSWWKELEEGQPLLEIPNSSIMIADSVVKDYCNGLLACNMGDAMPGLFYLPGEMSVAKIKSDHKLQLEAARIRQNNWFRELVKLADIMWARSNGNPLSISDDARMAARELNLNDKDWLKDFQTISLVRCAACGSLKNPAFPVCSICKAISDPEVAKKMNLTFAS